MKAFLKVGVFVLAIAGSATTVTGSAESADSLTGFGATIARWNQHHTADPKYVRNSAYDPGPGLGDNKSYGDRYFGVSVMSGRIWLYDMRLLPGTGIAEAKREVLASEFPRDAKITWFMRKGTCAQVIVRSKTLERAFHQFALVEFSSGDAADHYNPRDASQVVVTSATGFAKGFDC